MYSLEQDKQFERAIAFAVQAMESCHNPKPVLLHSLRIAFALLKQNYEMDVCIAALFHDLLEDTATEKSELKKHYGEKISDLVSLLTMDNSIDDYKEQYMENFKRCMSSKLGLVIRCADILDNSKFLPLANAETQNKVIEKHLCFHKMAYEGMKEEPIWRDFEKYIEEIKEKR